MAIRAQRELMAFNFQLSLTAERLSSVERHIGLDMRMNDPEGMRPEEIDRLTTLLDLVDAELAHAQRDLERCRNLGKQVFKALGYSETPLPPFMLNDDMR